MLFVVQAMVKLVYYEVSLPVNQYSSVSSLYMVQTRMLLDYQRHLEQIEHISLRTIFALNGDYMSTD